MGDRYDTGTLSSSRIIGRTMYKVPQESQILKSTSGSTRYNEGSIPLNGRISSYKV